MTDLNLCPFCGSHGEFGVVNDPDSQDHGGHFVQCTNPRCHGCIGLRFACGDDPRPHLADAWNNRAPDPRIAELEAQLAEASENIRQNLVELERINHTKATDFNMVRQLIVDNRATLSKIGGNHDG
jgi:hypothetical protein